MKLSGRELKRKPRAHGLKLLGTMITLDGSCEVEMCNRLSAVWNAVAARKHVFYCYDAYLSSKIKFLNRTVQASSLWGAEVLHLTSCQLQHIDTAQKMILRKMMRRKRRNSGTWLEWQKCTVRLARHT